MKKFGFILILFLLLALQSSAYAVLNLELTKGIDKALPIAITPFKFQGNEKLPVDIAAIIMNDLRNSGQFKVLESSKLKQLPEDVNKLDFKYWQGVGINNVVLGTVQAQGNSTYQVSFYLLDVYKNFNNNHLHLVANYLGSSLNSNINPVLTNQTYVVKAKELRHLAHKIADVIYQKLTNQPGVFATKIAYVKVQRRKGERTMYSLMVADADGYNPRAILISDQPIMSLAWSPNSKQIAYVSFANRKASLYISEIATGRQQLVSQFPGINGAPAWSSDGKQLAAVFSQGDGTKIFLIDLHSGKMKQLTKGWNIDTEPAFSPDGKSLAFTSDRAGSPQIYIMNLSNNKIERVTFSGNYNARASFTPDGKNIVMLHRDTGSFNIAMQNLASGTVTILSNAGNDQSPSVAPNGHMIIYATHDQDYKTGALALVSVDGKVKLKLPESDGEIRDPAWGGYQI